MKATFIRNIPKKRQIQGQKNNKNTRKESNTGSKNVSKKRQKSIKNQHKKLSKKNAKIL